MTDQESVHESNETASSAAFLVSPEDRTAHQDIIAKSALAESMVENFMTPGTFYYDSLQRLTPDLREQYIDLFRQEIAALQALDPATATREQTAEISNNFHKKREEITSNS